MTSGVYSRTKEMNIGKYKRSEETKKRMSLAMVGKGIGRKPWNKGIKLTKEQKKNIIGNKNCKWKGGRNKCSNGYIEVYCPGHPYGIKHNKQEKDIVYVLEHRLIMEKYLGRYLKPNEIVHHINGKRDDNRIENLKLTTSGKHCAEHNSKRIHTKKCKEKHRINALKRKRDSKGGFLKCQIY